MPAMRQRRANRNYNFPNGTPVNGSGQTNDMQSRGDNSCERGLADERDEHIEYIPTNLARFKEEPLRSDARSIEAQAAGRETLQDADEDDALLQRPLNGRCCSCLPCSRALHYRDTFQQLGVVDCLDMSGQRHEAGRWRVANLWRLMRELLTAGSDWLFTNVSFSTLASNERVAEELQRGDTRTQALAQATIGTMRASMSLAVLRFAGFFFSWLLNRHVSSLVVPRGQLEMLRLATAQRHPVVFVPLHRSHMDYIVLHYALLRCGIRVPYVAAGDNLNIPFISWFLRRLGAFFIRRRISPQDTLYRTLMHAYVQQLLQNRMNLEFYIEGGRSRSGRACPPRTGLLSIVVDTLLDKHVDDVLVVPVAVQYELVFDRSLIREQLGLQKQRESVLHAVRSAWRLLRTPLGHVRIDLCQPILLSEFLRRHDSPQSVSDFCPRASCLSLRTCVDPAPRPATSPSPSAVCLSEDATATTDDRRRMLVATLAQHVMHSAMHAQALMCTNLTAYLLLTEYRQGVSLVELANAFCELRARLAFDELRDCGFSLRSRRDALLAVERSVQLLNANFIPLCSTTPTSDMSQLIAVESRARTPKQSGSVSMEDTQFLRPNVRSHEAALTLAYYAAPVQSAFAMQSVVVTAALSLAAERGLFKLQQSIYDEPCLIELEALNTRAQLLSSLLKNEFCLFPPCSTFDTALRRTLDHCVANQLICDVPPDSPLLSKQALMTTTSSTDDRTHNRVVFGVDEYEEDDFAMEDDGDYSEDDDQAIQRQLAPQQTFLSLRLDNVTTLRALKAHAHSIIPLVDAYVIVFEQCASLAAGAENESVLFARIVAVAQSNEMRFAETFSLDTLRRALNTFVCSGALQKHTVDDVITYQLSEQFADAERRNSYTRLLHTLALDC